MGHVSRSCAAELSLARNCCSCGPTAPTYASTERSCAWPYPEHLTRSPVLPPPLPNCNARPQPCARPRPQPRPHSLGPTPQRRPLHRPLPAVPAAPAAPRGLRPQARPPLPRPLPPQPAPRPPEGRQPQPLRTPRLPRPPPLSGARRPAWRPRRSPPCQLPPQGPCLWPAQLPSPRLCQRRVSRRPRHHSTASAAGSPPRIRPMRLHPRPPLRRRAPPLRLSPRGRPRPAAAWRRRMRPAWMGATQRM
jgi:hypothetical protein